jgi:hypothetical protein
MATRKKSVGRIEELKPDPANPRTITERASEGLRYSLKEYGDLSGIVWNERTGELVSGHQRVSQLKLLGAKISGGDVELPDGQHFRVRVVDWPADKQRAANVVANNPAIGGEFTPELDETLAQMRATMDRQAYEMLQLQKIKVPKAINEFELGDGNIKEKTPTEVIQVVVPSGLRKKAIQAIRPAIEEIGGAIIE